MDIIFFIYNVLFEKPCKYRPHPEKIVPDLQKLYNLHLIFFI